MSTRGYWSNAAEKTALEVQPGGPGNSWQLVSPDAEMDAISGGGRAVESRYVRGAGGNMEYLGTAYTGNRDRITTTVRALINGRIFPKGPLHDMSKGIETFCNYPFVNLRVRQKCGDPLDRTDYDQMIMLIDAAGTGKATNNPLAVSMSGTDQDVAFQDSVSAGMMELYTGLAPLNLRTKLNSDYALNKVRYIEDQEWWAVGDQDDTPGYLSTASPTFYWTTDDGLTWSSAVVGNLLEADGLDVIRAGENIVIASRESGVVWAREKDVKNGVTNPWTAATGLSTGTPAAISCFDITPDGHLWLGYGQRAYRSKDNGRTWTRYAETSNDAFESVSAYSSDLVAFGTSRAGDNERTIYRWHKGEIRDVYFVTNTTVVGDELIVRIPPNRPEECYFGTSAGEIFRSTNFLDDNPTFTKMTFPQANQGQIQDIQFTGYRGHTMFILQQNTAKRTRLLMDTSGGALKSDVEVIKNFDVMPDGEMNSIAVATPHKIMGVGELDTAASGATVVLWAAHDDR